MSETTIRMNVGDVINIVREKYKVPEDEPLFVEIVAGFELTEYPSRRSHTMNIRIGDINRVFKASRDYLVEYEIHFGCKNRLKAEKEIKEFAENLVKNHGRVKDVYNEFSLSYNDMKKE